MGIFSRRHLEGVNQCFSIRFLLTYIRSVLLIKPLPDGQSQGVPTMAKQVVTNSARNSALAAKKAPKAVISKASQAPSEPVEAPLPTLLAALETTTALVNSDVIRLSDEQLAIAQAVKTGKGNLLVRARAGTGKTYLIRRCVPLMLGEIAVAAYNRKIAREIREKLAADGQAMRSWAEVQAHRSGLDVGTFHSFGWRVLSQRLRGVRLEGGGKNGAGFYKFDVIAERLEISKPLHTIVRKAMERAQERLLEIPTDPSAMRAIRVESDRTAVQAFLDSLIPLERAQWREMTASIANWYRSHGYVTERQMSATRMAARNARMSIPAGLTVGAPKDAVVVPAPQATAPQATGPKPIGSNNEIDPAWLALAHHHALALDLPSDDSIEMQMLSAEMSRGGEFVSIDDVREVMLKRCLVLAARAIHESAKMASEEFTHKYRVRGQVVEGEKFNGVISYGEMLYLPLYFNMPIPTYDWVCVDEAQDSNPARREFAKRMCKPSCRMLWVGDDRQAIYGWAGADNDALDQIIVQFACTVYPMTVTFRCGKTIVKLAQTLVPDYKAADINADGTVSNMNEDEFSKADMQPTDAIICRNTAPLVRTAYKLIGRGVACHVEGKNIGKQLLPLLYRWSRIKNVAPYSDKLREYRDTETAKLMAKNDEAAAEQLNDRVETIFAIIEYMPKGSLVSEIQAYAEKLFADSEDGEPAQHVTLLTIHRSKGLEYPRVFGLGTNKYLPSPYARQDWQQQQEANLLYVNYTRAISAYVDVNVA